MSGFAWPLVALVALALVWLRTRPMGDESKKALTELGAWHESLSNSVSVAAQRTAALEAAVVDLKRRVESADVKKLGRAG